MSCSPVNVAKVQLLNPNEAKPKDATATANRDLMETALTGISGTVRGSCSNVGPHKGQLCVANSDCDSSAGSGNGTCKGRFVAFAPPLTTHSSCTAFVPIQVPLRQTATAFKTASTTLRVKMSAGDVGRPPKTSNWLKLTCKPHP